MYEARGSRRSSFLLTAPFTGLFLSLSLLLAASTVGLVQTARDPAGVSSGALGSPAALPERRQVILATTTSTQDSGLLDVLVPLFERQTGYRVKTISAGTGAALALGARGEADVLLVHAPAVEERWMAEGNGIERLRVMYNDFVVVGPPADQARIRGETSIIAVLRKIAAQQALWISRDDRSGTDQLEKRLWQETGFDPRGASWYVTSGQGMGMTLTLAGQRRAYTLADRATYLARRDTLESQIVFEGGEALVNVYHVMPVNPTRFPGVPINAQGGKAFARFLVAPDTQRVIGAFGVERYGQPLFTPSAAGDA